MRGLIAFIFLVLFTFYSLVVALVQIAPPAGRR
ncbi:hypothetical protein C8D97_10450 [Pleionea mediterranea]|uniref:Uncharacterized protein n=1 Tax=Pleionea mediterranea TaxID=523701 RepID=A0A316FWX9_9GAMM|nr:hypothetical protein C8D97_10450 [Pleionea mediterranea]